MDTRSGQNGSEVSPQPAQAVSVGGNQASRTIALDGTAWAAAQRSTASGLAGEAGSFFSQEVTPTVLAALRQLLWRAGGPVTLFGMLLVPSPEKSLMVEGTVPGRADIRYAWNKSETRLYVDRFMNGGWVPIAEGVRDYDGVFHDKAGTPFARIIGHSAVAIDLWAIPEADYGRFVVPPPSTDVLLQGTVPGRSDLIYEWNKDETRLYVSRLIDGQWVPAATGLLHSDGAFYDRAGRPFARILDRATGLIAIDAEATLKVGKDEKDGNGDQDGKGESDTGGDSGAPSSLTNSSDERAKLCPDPIKEDQTGRSENAKEYQSRVARLPRGLAIRYNNVDYDGCPEPWEVVENDMTLREAKSNYENMVDEAAGNWKLFFREGWPDGKSGWPKMERQIWSQIAASNGHRIEWHFQIKAVAEIVRAWAIRTRVPKNFVVIYNPTGYD
jgi:hypothetical protein